MHNINGLRYTANYSLQHTFPTSLLSSASLSMNSRQPHPSTHSSQLAWKIVSLRPNETMHMKNGLFRITIIFLVSIVCRYHQIINNRSLKKLFMYVEEGITHINLLVTCAWMKQCKFSLAVG